MLKWLGDNRWQGCGVFVGLIGLPIALISLYLAFHDLKVQSKEEEQKTLNIFPSYVSLLLNVSPEIADRVKVLLDDKEVNNYEINLIDIENAGTVPIASADYEEPITFIFPQNTEILEVVKVDSTPDDIEIESTIVDNTVTIFPFLLNKNERLSLKITVINTDHLADEYPYRAKARAFGTTVNYKRNEEAIDFDGIYIDRDSYQKLVMTIRLLAVFALFSGFILGFMAPLEMKLRKENWYNKTLATYKYFTTDLPLKVIKSILKPIIAIADSEEE